MRGINVTGTREAIVTEIKDTIGKAFGEDGKRVRRNVEMMRDTLRVDYNEGARDVLLRFLEA